MKSTLFATLLVLLCHFANSQSYKNFKTSVYTRAYEVQKMEDPAWLDSTWKTISSQLHVDKIYLETHRDLLIVDENTLTTAIEFFKSKGLEVAGGITYTIDESNQFQTFCYQDPEIRQKAIEIIEYTASFFDEVILDDFFFTSCKCHHCIEAKGNRSWTDFRLELMTEATTEVIMKPAKAVNPNCKVIIKYPNWYEHFQALGFNLETQPALFDGLYTGTETRDAVRSNQHLQPYLGYLVFRYYDHLKPGHNGGGWVDTGGMSHFDRYAEQLWLTLLAKAPEMTLFDYRQMLYPLREILIPEWSHEKVSFSYDSFLPLSEEQTIAAAAGHSLNQIDAIIGELGEPYGVKSYKPFHSNGEDFLQNYLGMIGIPMELVSKFPMEDGMLILTEQAKFDPEIVSKIQQRLEKGKDVIITSGLLNALQDRGIRNIVDLEYTSRKATVKDFMLRRQMVEGETEIIIPQIQYFTNDSWEVISGMDDELGWPILHQGKFSNATLYLLTIPENFANLYDLPKEVLNSIRSIACKSMDFTLEGTSKVALFTYTNSTFVVQSFNNVAKTVQVILNAPPSKVTNLATGEDLKIEIRPKVEFWGRVYNPEKYICNITLPPHSFQAFKVH